MTCPKCRGPVTQPATGRPRRWCSDGCKKAAEREVARLDQRIAAHESRMAELRVELASGAIHNAYQRDVATASIAALEAEVATAEVRLRALLADEGVAGRNLQSEPAPRDDLVGAGEKVP